MDESWISTSAGGVAMAVVSAVAIYAALILYTRLTGLRSFSKMSSFDFAITVAIGSLVASTILTPRPPLLLAVVALAALYALQAAVARLRHRFSAVSSLVDNQPVLLMEDGRMLDGALREENVTRADILAKLREANVLRLDQVRAVVLESTGDVTVLHGEPDVARCSRSCWKGCGGTTRHGDSATGTAPPGGSGSPVATAGRPAARAGAVRAEPQTSSASQARSNSSGRM
jgi:hypothetical protein